MIRVYRFAVLAVLCITQSAIASSLNGSTSPLTYEQMRARGEIRMAMPYGRTSYVDARGHILGFSPELARYLGDFLSTKYKKRIKIEIVPIVAGQLLNTLDRYQADFAVDYFQEYKERPSLAAYAVYDHTRSEDHIVVSRKNSSPLNRLEDLSGQTVCVGHLTRSNLLDEINEKLPKDKQIHIFKDDLILSDEDLLQMLDAGLIEHIWVARWKAKLWQPVLSNIQLNEATVRSGVTPSDLIVHQSNRDLANDILEFAVSPDLEKALQIYRTRDFQYRKNALKNPVAKAEWQRFESMHEFFRQFGHQERLDPLFLAGLGFQESALNQSAQSPMGAIGVMQLLPGTGASMGVGNIYELKPNIHAGAKYMNSLLYALSLDQALPDAERAFFAVAAYNAGPNNIRKARELAAKMGFDPNRWFFHVEMATAKLVGSETFLYVRNVYKYYITYDVWQRKIALQDANLHPQRNSPP